MALSCMQLESAESFAFQLSAVQVPFQGCSLHFEREGVLFHGLSHSSDTNAVDQHQAGASTEKRWFQGRFYPHCIIWSLHVLSGPVDAGLWFWAVSWSAPFAWCPVCWVSLGVTIELCPLVKKVLVSSWNRTYLAEWSMFSTSKVFSPVWLTVLMVLVCLHIMRESCLLIWLLGFVCVSLAHELFVWLIIPQ